MAQNIYDDDGFFAGYRALPRSIDGLAGAPEWATMRSMLPDMAGARVLDLGCGFGWFARWAAEAGATSTLGVDLSSKMLDQAQRDTPADLNVTYRQADLEELRLAGAEFDFVHSSLAVHYVADWGRLARVVFEALVGGGRFVYSTEHPIFSASAEQRFVQTERGPTWPVTGYLNEGERKRRFVVDGVVKHHRTIGTQLNTLVDVGFTMDRVCEWGPSDKQVSANPHWVHEQERPLFLLVAAVKP